MDSPEGEESFLLQAQVDTKNFFFKESGQICPRAGLESTSIFWGRRRRIHKCNLCPVCNTWCVPSRVGARERVDTHEFRVRGAGPYHEAKGQVDTNANILIKGKAVGLSLGGYLAFIA